MKKVISLLTVLLLVFIGCTKDSINDENLDLQGLKRAKVPVPMKADFCMTPNMNGGFILIVGLDPTNPNSYLPKELWVSGHCTQMGEVIMEQSIVKMLTAVITPYGIKSTAEGKMTADNGDYYFITSTMLSNPMTKAFTGNVHMFGGVGKFKDATGDVVMTGQGSCWTAEGTMTYTN